MVTQHACQICSGINLYGLKDSRSYRNPLKKLCQVCQLKFKCKTDPLKTDENGLLPCVKRYLGTFGFIVLFALSLWVVHMSLHRTDVPKPDSIHSTKKPAVNAVVR
jgi:hypothetical protein